jgi:hypothetical protein
MTWEIEPGGTGTLEEDDERVAADAVDAGRASRIRTDTNSHARGRR